MPAAKETRDKPRSLSRLGVQLLVAYAISGAAALAYEVAWMRELGNTFGATAYASATMLTAFMLGLGLGSVAGGWLAQRLTTPMRAAARAELAVAGSSILALLGIVYLPNWFFDTLSQANLEPLVLISMQIVVSLAVMLLPTVAMGLTFPLVMESVGRVDKMGVWAGMLYSTNTGGAIVGSLAAGFLLIPWFGAKGALVAAALMSAAAAWMLAEISSRTEGTRPYWRSAEPYVALAVIALLVVLPAPATRLVSLTVLDRYASSEELRTYTGATDVVYDDETPYSRVSVFRSPDGTLSLRNGSLIEGSSAELDRRTTTMLAVAPLVSASSQSSAMVVGLGTGYTSAALLERGAEVTTVEINPGVVNASELFMGDTLSGNPAWRLVIDDARAFLQTTDSTFDVITSEPSWPLAASVAPLFTKEFMAAANSRLNPGGTFCQWLPDYLLTAADLEMMYKTARQVFPRVDVWAVTAPDGSPGEIILIGFKDEGAPPQADIAAEAEKVGESLGFPGSLQYFDSATWESAITNPAVPVNTDDHSRLEYRVLWNFLDRLNQIRAQQGAQ